MSESPVLRGPLTHDDSLIAFTSSVRDRSHAVQSSYDGFRVSNLTIISTLRIVPVIQGHVGT